MYKINIILPTYNSEKFLDRTLKSVINQTIFKDIELIIVDDCSTDSTRELVQKYHNKYSNIKPIFKKENSGEPSVGRNIGMGVASTDYIMFLDHDDVYYADNVCEILYNKITREKVDLVSGTYEIISSNENTNNHKFKEDIHIKNFKENMSVFSYSPSLWTKIFRKKTIIENNIQFSFGGTGDDLIFVSEYIMHADGLIFLKDLSIIKYNRLITTSFTNSISENYCEGLIKSYTQLKDIFKENMSPEIMEYLFAHTSFLLNQLTNSNLHKKTIINILRKSQPLYHNLKKNGLYFKNKKYQLCLNLIINSKFEETVLIFDLINELKQKNKKNFNIFKIIHEIDGRLDNKELQAEFMKIKINALIFEIDQISEEFKEEFFEKLKCEFKEIHENQIPENLLYKHENILNSNSPEEYQLKIEIRKLEKKLIKSRKIICEMESSKSWRITKPLRQFILSLKNNKANFKAYKLIKNGIFDEEYYKSQFNNKFFIIPLLHYIYKGYKQGKNPNKKFNNNFYLKSYSHVKNAGMNPLVHFVLYGRFEGKIKINPNTGRMGDKMVNMSPDDLLKLIN